MSVTTLAAFIECFARLAAGPKQPPGEFRDVTSEASLSSAQTWPMAVHDQHPQLGRIDHGIQYLATPIQTVSVAGRWHRSRAGVLI